MGVLRALLLTVSGILVAACIQDDGTRWTPLSPLEMMSLDEERELGMGFDRALQKQVPVIHDPLVAGFINDLGQEIVRGIEPQPFIYRFRVIEDRALNAFAVPGGYIYLHSGTILAAGSLDELAGVMGHEIAHVKGRHVARLRQKSQLPDFFANIAAIGVAAAVGAPEVMIAGQAINVALKLSFTREFEAEADENGVVFMSRAGYEPTGIERFFERILSQRTLPPYLYSHPDVADRIDAVRASAETLHPLRSPDPTLEERFRRVKRRLGLLLQTGRNSLPSAYVFSDHGPSPPALAEAHRLVELGRIDAALAALTRTAIDAPGDPRVTFEIADLLHEQGRYDGAVAAYRRTIELDPSRAHVFYRLGMAYKALGDRQRAVYAFEQALLRAGPKSALRRQAEWEVSKLTFGVVVESGFTDALDVAGQAGAEIPSLDSFRADARQLAWWGRVSPHFAAYTDRIRVRWRDPTGRVVDERNAESFRRVYVVSSLEPGDASSFRAGEWTVETLLDDEVVFRERVRVEP